MRQWLTEGITRAQDPGVLLRGIACIRKSPILSAIIITVLFALTALLISEWIRSQNQSQLIENLTDDLIAQTDMGSLGEVTSAQKQLRTLESRYGKNRMPFARAGQQLVSAFDVLMRHEKMNQLKNELQILDQRFRITGPWENEIEDRKRVHGLSGLKWSHLDRNSIDSHKKHPLSDQLLKNLVHLQVATLIMDKEHAHHDHDDHEPLNNYIAAVGLGESWESMSRVFELATVSAHEVVLETDNGEPIDPRLIEKCLGDPEVGDLLLALSKPNDQLIAYANARWQAEPDSFWPCIVISRNALVQSDLTKSRIHALIALGQEGKSIWPQLTLAYIEMLSDNVVQSQVWLGNILRNHPDHLETRILRSVILLKSGNKEAAQKEVDALSAWSHFHVHEQHGGGHPMDISLDLLKKGGVRLHTPNGH